MLTSGQIAAMMAQQQQNFAAASGYSQAISSQLPPAFNAGGIGAYGMGGPGGQQFPQIPYAPIARAGFNYGSSTLGYGLGNQAGGMGAAAVAGGAVAGVGLLGMVPGIGRYFDPFHGAFSAGQAAMAAGRGVGGIIGAGALAALPGMAIGTIAAYGGAQIAHGAQQQMAINQSLGAFGFSNPMSRSGHGFSRADAMAIGDMAREMSVLPELRTSMSEITRIMERVNQAGMMSGVRNAQEYANRFKQTMTELRDIARIMGTTKEEAVAMLQQSHQAGAYSGSSVQQHMLRTQAVMGMTGMNYGQMAALQAQGAQMSFAMGGTRLTGSRSITRIAGELGTANRMGVLSDERLMEMTGLEGPEAIQALSGTVNQLGYRMGRSSLGTAMTLALGEMKNGQYTGRMDESLVQRFREGTLGKDELLAMARQKVHSGGRGSMLSYAAHKNKLRAEMVGATGAQGIAMELQSIMGERGWDNPNAVNIVMRRYGVDEREAETILELGKQMSSIQGEMGIASRNEARSSAERAYLKENYSWDAVKHDVRLKWEKAIAKPLEKMGARISNSVAEYVEDFEDDLFGRYTAQITERTSRLITMAQLGDSASRSMLGRGGAAVPGGVNLARGGGYLTRSLGGLISPTQGQGLEWVLNRMGKPGLVSEQGVGDAGLEGLMRPGRTILSYSGMSTASVIDKDQLEAAQKMLQGGNIDPRLAKFFSSSAGVDAANEFQSILRSNGAELRDLSKTDPVKAMQRAIELVGGPLGPLGQGREVMGASTNFLTGLQDQSMDVSIFQQFAKQMDMDQWQSLGLAGVAERMGMLQENGIPSIARNSKQALKQISAAFGSQSSLARTMLSQDGDAAVLLQQALANPKLMNEMQKGGAGSDALKKMLASLPGGGMSLEKYNSLRDDVLSVAESAEGEVTTANGTKVSTPAAIAKYMEQKNKEGIALLVKDRDETAARMRQGFTDYSEELGGVKSKAGRAALERLRALSQDTSVDAEGLPIRTGVVEAGMSLLDVGRQELGMLSHVTSPEVLLARDAASGVRRRFRRGRQDKYGDRSLASLGFSHEELSKTFEKEDVEKILAHAGELAGTDGRKGVSKKELESIERYMAEVKINPALNRVRGESGSTLGGPPTDKSIAELGKSVSLIASQMGGLTDAVNALAKA